MKLRFPEESPVSGKTDVNASQDEFTRQFRKLGSQAIRDEMAKALELDKATEAIELSVARHDAGSPVNRDLTPMIGSITFAEIALKNRARELVEGNLDTQQRDNNVA